MNQSNNKYCEDKFDSLYNRIKALEKIFEDNICCEKEEYIKCEPSGALVYNHNCSCCLKLIEEVGIWKERSEYHRNRYEESHQHFKDKCKYWDEQSKRADELRFQNELLKVTNESLMKENDVLKRILKNT